MKRPALFVVVVVSAFGGSQAWATPCELATPKACYERGIELFKANDVAAAGFFERACESGVAEGCTELGFMLMEGMLVARDDARSLTTSLRACELGSGLGCNNAFVMVRDSRGTTKEDIELRRLADRSCALDDAEGCYLSAAVHGEPIGGALDQKVSNAALDRSCKLEFGMACAVVAHRLLEGTFAYAKDEVRGVKMMARACELGSAEACTLVGDWSLAGVHGLKGDREKALMLYRAACELEGQGACKKAEALAAATARGTFRGKLGRRSSKRVMMTFADGDAPPVGAVGEVSTQTKMLGADVSLAIAKVVVKKVEAKSVELEVTEDLSEIVIDGAKINHWKPGVALSVSWQRAP